MSYSFCFRKGQDLQQTNGNGHWRDGWMERMERMEMMG